MNSKFPTILKHYLYMSSCKNVLNDRKGSGTQGRDGG